MHRLLVRALSCTLLALPPSAVGAEPLTVSTGVDSTVGSIFHGIVNALLSWSSLVALALFLLGAVLMVGSGGHDTTLSAGKKIMKAAVIGLALILASWLILSTVVYFITG